MAGSPIDFVTAAGLVTVQGRYGARFCSPGTKFCEHYECRGTNLMRAIYLSPVTIFCVTGPIKQLSDVCKGTYSIFVAISESLVTLNPGSERRSIFKTESALLVSLVLFLPQEQRKITTKINSFVLIFGGLAYIILFGPNFC